VASVQEKAMCVLWFFGTEPFIKMQRHYRTQHGKYSPLDNVMQRWLRKFQENGSVVAAVERVTSQMLENSCRGSEYSLKIFTCHEKRAYRSCLADSTDNKTL
jgi:TATA-binding protein-associated factor Taf7